MLFHDVDVLCCAVPLLLSVMLIAGGRLSSNVETQECLLLMRMMTMVSVKNKIKRQFPEPSTEAQKNIYSRFCEFGPRSSFPLARPCRLCAKMVTATILNHLYPPSQAPSPSSMMAAPAAVRVEVPTKPSWLSFICLRGGHRAFFSELTWLIYPPSTRGHLFLFG